MSNPFESAAKKEKAPEKFEWRTYVKNPEALSAESVKKLDTLSNLLETDTGASEFLEPLRKGQFKGPLLPAFLNFYRDALTPAEKSNLLDDLEKAEMKGAF